jgi:hypothetical protein
LESYSIRATFYRTGKNFSGNYFAIVSSNPLLNSSKLVPKKFGFNNPTKFYPYNVKSSFLDEIINSPFSVHLYAKRSP